jgi:large subunit ribosomal protein LX
VIETKIFRVKGWFQKPWQKQVFVKELPALSEQQAMERIYSEVGSKHKVKRNLLHIEEIVEIKPEEAKDPRIKAMVG